MAAKEMEGSWPPREVELVSPFQTKLKTLNFPVTLKK
jgi:hypothetical protein